jgi:opacity protein-like surface antigen
MKKMLSAAAIIATGLFASQASAAVMECYIDTQAYDHYSAGECSAIIYGASQATAVFRVTGSNKPVNSVIWGGATKSCGTAGTNCSITIRSYRVNNATATILYQDGTWDTASAIATFEDGR